MNLLELQRRMAEDVQRPLTPDFQMQGSIQDGSSIEDLATSYIKPNALLSSFERLEIYNRQYWFRLIAAVSEDFPALNAVLGAKRFDALILSYLKENPSTSWTLRDLGAKLPAFLECHAEEFGGRRHRLAVDVAHLEWAYIDAYDGKRLTPLTSEDLQAIGPDSRLSLQPHLRLLALSYPVDELVLAVRRETPESEVVSSAAIERGSQPRIKLPSMKQSRVYLAVHRFDNSVYYRPIEREMFLLLAALRDGASIAEALNQAFSATRLTPAEQAARVQHCFAYASELGWLCLRRESDDNPDEFVM
jgi:hypothetical protein